MYVDLLPALLPLLPSSLGTNEEGDEDDAALLKGRTGLLLLATDNDEDAEAAPHRCRWRGKRIAMREAMMDYVS